LPAWVRGQGEWEASYLLCDPTGKHPNTVLSRAIGLFFSLPANWTKLSPVRGKCVSGVADGPAIAALRLAGCLALCLAKTASAQWFDQGPVFTVIEENDLVVDTDRHYTQGIKLTYLHTDNDVPAWLLWLSQALPPWGFTVHATKLGTQIGQDIYTPADLSSTQLLTNDRPYGGWFYTGLILQRRGLTTGGKPVLENFRFDAGIIGPSSLADRAQTWVHEVRGFETPRGWDHQLRNEPGFALKYERRWLFSQSHRENRWLDFIPQTGLSLGNAETSFRAGGSVRLGWNLPEDFGAQTVHSLSPPDGGWSVSRCGGQFGAYAFVGAEGSAVLFSEFLDGNLWHASHHVEHEVWVGEWKVGLAVVLNRVELGYTQVYRTREFTGQTEISGYGSVWLKVKF